MTNNIPISDNHTHIWRELPLDDTVKFFSDAFENFGYDSITTLAINEQPRNAQKNRALAPNLKGLYLKKIFAKRIYSYAGLHLMQGDKKSTASDFLNQAKMYYDAGFDGMKLFYSSGMYEEGYPQLRYKIYEPYFKYMEDMQFPIIIHIGGPEMCFRDIEEIPPDQRKWHVKNCYIHFNDMIDDLISMMNKFPKLRIVLAHFGFISEHIDVAKEWLEKYENMYFDLTPSLFMYYDFQKKKKEWTEFFIKYQDRIIYGTDIGSNVEDLERAEPKALNHVVKGFFCETETIHEFNEDFSPMVLPDDVLKKIYKENMLKLHNYKEPREISDKAIFPEIEFEEKYGGKSEFSEKNFGILKKAFGYCR